MNPSPEKFVLDANVFIHANRVFYGLDFCPGFWDALVHYRAIGQLRSVDSVLEELDKGKDALSVWARQSFGVEGFESTREPATLASYKAMGQWVQANPQFSIPAKNEFLQVADGWLVAFAHAKKYIVVTQEVPNPEIKKKVPIPNLCEAHGVKYVNIFDMLRRLNVRLSWSPES